MRRALIALVVGTAACVDTNITEPGPAAGGRCDGHMSLLSSALLLGVAVLVVYLLATLVFPEKF